MDRLSGMMARPVPASERDAAGAGLRAIGGWDHFRQNPSVSGHAQERSVTRAADSSGL